MTEKYLCKKCSEKLLEPEKTYQDTWICLSCHNKLKRFYRNRGFSVEDIEEIKKKDRWALEIMFIEIDNGYSFKGVLEEYGYLEYLD